MNRYKTLQEDYESGATIRELATKYGVSYRAVWQAMEKRGIERRSKAVRDQTGERNPNWLGDKASYFGMHKRLRKIKGKPSHCENCGITDPHKKYQWANISGNFGDMDDYKRLCISCHAKFDNTVSRLPKKPKATGPCKYCEKPMRSSIGLCNGHYSKMRRGRL